MFRWSEPSPKISALPRADWKGVKALGVLAHGRAQLTMNITDLQATPVSAVYARVLRLAAKHKGDPIGAEIIGLLPQIAYEQDSDWMRLLDGFDPATKVLERRLEATAALARRPLSFSRAP